MLGSGARSGLLGVSSWASIAASMSWRIVLMSDCLLTGISAVAGSYSIIFLGTEPPGISPC